jgi:hypothetical protein
MPIRRNRAISAVIEFKSFGRKEKATDRKNARVSALQWGPAFGSSYDGVSVERRSRETNGSCERRPCSPYYELRRTSGRSQEKGRSQKYARWLDTV